MFNALGHTILLYALKSYFVKKIINFRFDDSWHFLKKMASISSMKTTYCSERDGSSF
jgi:hypothetical protein